MNKLTLYPWESRELAASAILILPYAPVDAAQIDEIKALEPAAIIPPYAPGRWSLIAQTASIARGNFPGLPVMVPMVGANRHDVKRHLAGFTRDGFDAFAFPEMLAGVPTVHAACFWDTSGVLSENVWYHVAGGTGAESPADLKGFWTWSEGGL